MPRAHSLKSPATWRLYVIVDRVAAGNRDLTDLAARAIHGGADVIQLRNKTALARELIAQATALLRVTRPAGVPLLINDRADIAKAVGADGVHVGQEDLPIAAARQVLGPRGLIGQSTHNLAQALAAAREGVDYLALGPIFPTPTKPEYGRVGTALIRRALPKLSVPAVCIGGIDLERLEAVIAAGAQCVAVVRAVCGARNPEAAARHLKNSLNRVARPANQPL